MLLAIEITDINPTECIMVELDNVLEDPSGFMIFAKGFHKSQIAVEVNHNRREVHILICTTGVLKHLVMDNPTNDLIDMVQLKMEYGFFDKYLADDTFYQPESLLMFFHDAKELGMINF